MNQSTRLKLEDILSRAKKSAEQAEVFFSAVDDTPVIFEANRLKQLQTNEGMIVALRLVKNGRIGFSTATTLDDIGSLVSRATDVALFGAVARFELPDRQLFPSVAMHDPKAEGFDIERMVDLGQALIDRVRKHTPDLLCDASVGKGMASLCIMNSKGGQAEFRKTFFVLGVEGNLIKDTDMLFVGDGDISCQTIADIDMTRYASWSDRERIVVNVQTLYQEFKGDTSPANLIELFGSMAKLGLRRDII